jgi:hypothetical protein
MIFFLIHTTWEYYRHDSQDSRVYRFTAAGSRDRIPPISYDYICHHGPIGIGDIQNQT